MQLRVRTRDDVFVCLCADWSVDVVHMPQDCRLSPVYRRNAVACLYTWRCFAVYVWRVWWRRLAFTAVAMCRTSNLFKRYLLCPFCVHCVHLDNDASITTSVFRHPKHYLYKYLIHSFDAAIFKIPFTTCVSACMYVSTFEYPPARSPAHTHTHTH